MRAGNQWSAGSRWSVVGGRWSVLPFTIFTLLLLGALAPRAEAVEALNTGGYVTYVNDGLTNWTYHVFTNAGASGMKIHTLAAGGTVELLVVAGGGSGGGALHNGAGGGAGGLIYTNYTVIANTDYAVTVGSGGVAVAVNTSAVGNDGQDSKFGTTLTAKYGGGGSREGQGPGRTGGSAGGGSRGSAGGTALNLTPMQGNNGGAGVNNPSYGSGGGGGAGSAGLPGDANIGAGDGGSGTNLPAFVLWGDANNLGWFAGGGGGACDTVSGAGSTRAGLGGKGGGGNGGTNTTGQLRNGQPGQPNTGGGGGAAYSRATDSASGAGGSGIVIVRYQSLPPVLPYSWSGDILYATNLNGRLYGVHIFTNTVGTNYFTTTKDFKVEYLVIGGGGAGNSGKGGGGGAGGYRCSVVGELSGSNSTAEAVYPVSANVAYPVVVGAGGLPFAYNVAPAQVNKGGDSWFTNIVAIGGGVGKERGSPEPEPLADGGSGGGGGYTRTIGGSGVAGQGYPGGNKANSGEVGGGGGGGAGSPGINQGVASYGGDGGTGLVSSITGVAVGRAGGGQGAITGGGGSSIGASQCGGGTQASPNGVGSTGGGGASKDGGPAGSGGSGVVILRYDMTTPPKGTLFLLR
ncbi:MAG: hypothetical protein O2923_09130 [Verrucomicrobia bacterium]|nr:hypothetical protein [Verrucomicrobiota bacterium]